MCKLTGVGTFLLLTTLKQSRDRFKQMSFFLKNCIIACTFVTFGITTKAWDENQKQQKWKKQQLTNKALQRKNPPLIKTNYNRNQSLWSKTIKQQQKHGSNKPQQSTFRAWCLPFASEEQHRFSHPYTETQMARAGRQHPSPCSSHHNTVAV